MNIGRLRRNPWDGSAGSADGSAGFWARVLLKDLGLACPASLKGSGVLLKVLGSGLGGSGLA